MTTEQNNPPEIERDEEPQIFSVARDINGTHFNRRDFIEKAAITSAAVTVIASGCTLPIGSKNVDVQATVNSAISATENARIVTEMAMKEQEPAQQVEAPDSQPRENPSPTRTPRPTNTDTPVPATPTETASPTPLGINSTIKGDNVNFRSGPSTGYTPITRLPMGASVLLVGRLEDSTWVAVALSDPKKPGIMVYGWIKTNLINTVGLDLRSLPVVKDIPPTPTPLPGRYGNTGAGQTGMDYTITDQYGNVYNYNLPCGAALPAGATCTCNCVTVPRTCSCVDHTVGCPNDTHYWYPN